MKYLIEYDGLENEIVDKNRVIEYAKSRLKANPDEIRDWEFNINSMNVLQAIRVINSFNEEVFKMKGR